MKHHTHMILVSGQPTPNLTPMLDQEIQPEQVIMVVSNDMVSRADWLDDVLKPRGIHTSRWPIQDPYDLERMRNVFQTGLIDLPNSDLALNVTGGTKPMAIAAFQVFSDFGLPIYYVHPEQDRLIWLKPADRSPRDLENRLKLEPFFLAHGAILKEREGAFGVRDELFELCREIVFNVDQYQDAIKSLNWLVSGAANPALRTPAVPRDLANRNDFESLLYCFESRNLLRWEGENLEFASENDRFFVNGGWLEHYVHALVQRVAKKNPSIQDIGRGLNLVRNRGKSDAANELDVALLADNRLHVIECKTGSFDESEKGDGALYKLQTLSGQFGGLQAKAMLVSYQPLPQAVKRRAHTDKTEISAGPQLKTLEEKLSTWLRQK